MTQEKMCATRRLPAYHAKKLKLALEVVHYLWLEQRKNFSIKTGFLVFAAEYSEDSH